VIVLKQIALGQEREGAREVKTALLAALMISGLSQADADGYRAATKFEQIKAKCELVADGMQQNGFAFGSSAFVGGYALGSAIQGAIDHAGRYDHCMTLYGYVKTP
jgi:hypothetical protein